MHRRFAALLCVPLALTAAGCSSGGTQPLPPDAEIAGQPRPVTERFAVSTDRNYRYGLAFAPDPDRPVEVRYGDLLLAEGTDYSLDLRRRELRLLRALPPDSASSATPSLSVVYRPRYVLAP
ncbi:MAG TPA: hypothetical protein VM490_14285 [Armatimonadaceae bacterium]|jgi:hypothetical protein|nr:hypothetical protein [Armatimonadaceae bacterium]